MGNGGNRLGPLERGIQTMDPSLIIGTLKARCLIDESKDDGHVPLSGVLSLYRAGQWF
jgi:hypothetical protein